MKVKVPSLDVEKFESLWEKALAELPGLTEEWTNYNLADPGVVTVESLLFLLDVFYWQLDFFGEEEVKALKSLVGTEELSLWWKRHLGPHTGVSAQDLAQLVRERGGFDRAYVYADHEERLIRVIVVKKEGLTLQELLRLEDELEDLRPLTMDLVLLPPEETGFSLRLWLYPLAGYGRETLKEALFQALERYLSPVEGLNGQGWPPGRALYLSEILACGEKVPGVDGIARVSVSVYSPGSFDGQKIKPGRRRFPKLIDLEISLLEREEEPCL